MSPISLFFVVILVVFVGVSVGGRCIVKVLLSMYGCCFVVVVFLFCFCFDIVSCLSSLLLLSLLSSSLLFLCLLLSSWLILLLLLCYFKYSTDSVCVCVCVRACVRACACSRRFVSQCSVLCFVMGYALQFTDIAHE